jgi:hypothetical protein
MKYVIMVLMTLFMVSICYAGESNLTLANRDVLINQMKNDNGLLVIVRDAIANTTGSATLKAQAVLNAFSSPVMAWLDAKLTYDKVVKITAEDSTITYWHKVRQLKLWTESTQIDISGQNGLRAELEVTKTVLTQDYNKKINAIQALIDGIPTAPEDTE